MAFPGNCGVSLEFLTVFLVGNPYPGKLLEQIPWEALGGVGGVDSLKTFQGSGDFGNIGMMGAVSAAGSWELRDFVDGVLNCESPGGILGLGFAG